MPSKGKSRANKAMATSTMAAAPPRELAGELLYPSKKAAASCIAFEDLQALYHTEGWIPPPGTLRFRLPQSLDKSQREKARGLLTEQLFNCAVFEGFEALPTIHFLSTPAQAGFQHIQFLDLRIPEGVGEDRKTALIEACNEWKLSPGVPLPQALFLTSEEAQNNLTPQDMAIRVRRVPSHFMSQSSNFRINFHASLAPQLAVPDLSSGQLEPSIVQCMYGIFRSLPQGRRQLTDEVLVHVKTPGDSVARQVAAGWGDVARFKNDGSMYTFPLTYPGKVCTADRAFNVAPMNGYPYGLLPPPVAGHGVMLPNGMPHANGASTPLVGVPGVNGVPPPEVKIIEHCPRCGFQKVTPPNGIFNPQILGGKGRGQGQGRQAQSSPTVPVAQCMPYADMDPSPAAEQVTVQSAVAATRTKEAFQQHQFDAAPVRDDNKEDDTVSVASISSCDLAERGATTEATTTVAHEADGDCSSFAKEKKDAQEVQPSLFVNPLFFKLLQVTATEPKLPFNGDTTKHGSNGSLAGPNATSGPTTSRASQHDVQVFHAQVDTTTKQIEVASSQIGTALKSVVAIRDQRRPTRPEPVPRKRVDSGPETPPLPATLPPKPLDTFIDEADAKEEQEEGKPTTQYYYSASTRNWHTSPELDEAFDWLEREEKLAAIKKAGGNADILPPSSPLGSDLDETDFRTIVVDRLDDEPRPRYDALGNIDVSASPRTPTTSNGALPSSPSAKLARARPKRGRGGGTGGGLSLAAATLAGRARETPSRREQSPMPPSPIESQVQARPAALYQRLLEAAEQTNGKKMGDMGTGGPIDAASDWEEEGDGGRGDYTGETIGDPPAEQEPVPAVMTPAALLFPEMEFSDDEGEDDNEDVTGGFKSSRTTSDPAFGPGHSSRSTTLGGFASSDTRVDDSSSTTVEDDQIPIEKGVLFRPVEESTSSQAKLTNGEDEDEGEEDDFVDAQSHLPFGATWTDMLDLSDGFVPQFQDVDEDEATALAIAVAAAADDIPQDTVHSPKPHDYDYELALTLSLIEENGANALPPITTRPPAPYHPDSASGITRPGRHLPPQDQEQDNDHQDPFYTQTGPLDYDLFE